jgi:hypothetical protein
MERLPTLFRQSGRAGHTAMERLPMLYDRAVAQ